MIEKHSTMSPTFAEWPQTKHPSVISSVNLDLACLFTSWLAVSIGGLSWVKVFRPFRSVSTFHAGVFFTPLSVTFQGTFVGFFRGGGVSRERRLFIFIMS